MDIIKKNVLKAVDFSARRWIELSDKIHRNPETAFNEVKACKWLSDAARELGFHVEVGVAGIPTAFFATYDSKKPGPSIGIVVEYDALEGLGHACAHNTKCPAALCGAEAFIKTCPDFRGKIVILGCPAEESGGGKVLMVERGAIHGLNLDVCFEIGVAPEWGVGTRRFSRQGLTLTARGKSAHSGMKHHESINALDSLMFVMETLRYLSKTLGEGGIITSVVTNGGITASVIPDFAQIEVEIQGVTRNTMEKYVDLVERLADVSAEASGAEIAVKKSVVYANTIKTRCLADMVMGNLKDFGVDAEWLFDSYPIGCTDPGNISHIVPLETYEVAIGSGILPHTIEYREAAGSKPGHNVVVNGAKVLGMCLVDLLVHDSDDFLKKLRAEFKTARESQAKSI